VRWAQAIRTKGRAEPLPQGRPKGHGKLAPYQAFFEELVTQDPDITLFELRDALAEAEGVCAHHSSIACLLARLGYTYKKRRWWPPNAVVPR
jgi:transposase